MKDLWDSARKTLLLATIWENMGVNACFGFDSDSADKGVVENMAGSKKYLSVRTTCLCGKYPFCQNELEKSVQMEISWWNSLSALTVA
jgi:hypothetical protein